MVEEKKRLPLNEDDLTEDEKFVMRRFSSMVRDVLALVEIAIPPKLLDGTESKQYKQLRRLSQNAMYECRNEFLERFTQYFERFLEA